MKRASSPTTSKQPAIKVHIEIVLEVNQDNIILEGTSSTEEDVAGEQNEPQSNEENNSIARLRNNSDCMIHIISHVIDFKDRLKMELVSKNFQKLVNLADWSMPERMKTLEVCIQHDYSNIIVSFGSFEKCISYLDWFSTDNELPMAELMALLNKLLIARRSVKRVVYGSWRYHGWKKRSNDFVLTRILLEHLENFKNLNSLTLQNEIITEDAIEFINSPECKFKHLLRTLEYREMDGEPWMTCFMNKRLKNLLFRNLDFKQTDLFMNRLDELKIHLESVTLRIDKCNDVDAAQQGITKFSQRCEKLKLDLTNFELIVGRNICLLAKQIYLWSNVTHLILRYGFQADPDSPIVFKNIRYLHHLEVLKIIDIGTEEQYIALKEGIQDLKHLIKLHVQHRGSEMSPVTTRILVEGLPTTIEIITFKFVLFDNDSLGIFCQKMKKNLKNFKIVPCFMDQNSANHIFETFITELQNLSTFRFLAVIPWMLLRFIIEATNLNDVIVQPIEGIPKNAESVIQNHFLHFRSGEYNRFTDMELRNRRSSSLKFPIVPIDTTTERKCAIVNEKIHRLVK